MIMPGKLVNKFENSFNHACDHISFEAVSQLKNHTFMLDSLSMGPVAY